MASGSAYDFWDDVMCAIFLGELTPGEKPVRITRIDMGVASTHDRQILDAVVPVRYVSRWKLHTVDGEHTIGIGRLKALKARENLLNCARSSGNPQLVALSKMTTRYVDGYHNVSWDTVKKYHADNPDRHRAHLAIKAQRDARMNQATSQTVADAPEMMVEGANVFDDLFSSIDVTPLSRRGVQMTHGTIQTSDYLPETVVDGTVTLYDILADFDVPPTRHNNRVSQPLCQSRSVGYDAAESNMDREDWRELSTFHLASGGWRMNAFALTPEDKMSLASVELPLLSERLACYPVRAHFGTDTSCGKVALFSNKVECGKQKQDMGCRGFADLLHKIADDCGGINSLPDRLYIHASNFPTLKRGLLTLHYLATAELRRDVEASISIVHVPSQRGETNHDYELRAADAIIKQLGPCERRPKDALYLPDIKAEPDGLAANNAEKTLYIVEAKNGSVDFSDGVAQLVQYYAMARHHPTYNRYHIQSILVTSNPKQTVGYRFWQKLVDSLRNLNIYVSDCS